MAKNKQLDDMLAAIQMAQTHEESRQVLRCAIQEWGGPEGVAKELYLNATELDLGHANRVKIVLALFQAMLAAPQEGLGVDDPETLKALLEQQMKDVDADDQ